LLRDGARIVRSAEDVLEDLRIGKPVIQPEPAQHVLVMNEDERRVLAVMSSHPHHIDDLAAEANLPVSRLSVLLMTMELQGMVRNAGAQHYIRL
jgi:predicted Rossmann fold nucleotide-binding protein DprA/Smf involved in DNA uptake